LIAAVTALVIYVLGALAIAMMIPKQEISVVAGLMEAFHLFFNDLGIRWAIYPIGIMIILGAIGELNAWIIGPVRALHATSVHGDLPPILQKLNKHEMPANLLVFQAIIVTITSLVFFFMPTTGSAFWILTAMSAQLYLLMYVLMFLAAIKLRYSHAHVKRSYKVPYKMPGIWFVGTLGTLSSLFAFFIAFLPPNQLKTGNIYFYEGFLIIGIAVMCLLPYIIYKLKAPHWRSHEKNS
jgi:amino acid transporter